MILSTHISCEGNLSTEEKERGDISNAGLEREDHLLFSPLKIIGLEVFLRNQLFLYLHVPAMHEINCN